MKKTLIFLALFALTINAQTYTPQKKDVKIPWAYTHQQSGDSLAQHVYVLNPVTVTGGATAIRQDSLLNVNKNMRSWLAALMGYVDELEAKNDSLKTKLNSIINELAGGKSYGRIVALSGTSVDTTRGSLFSYWFDASYYATVTTGDTVYASSDATFPATNRIVLTATTPYLYTGKLFKSSIPNFYLKRKAGAATISVQIYKRGF